MGIIDKAKRLAARARPALEKQVGQLLRQGPQPAQSRTPAPVPSQPPKAESVLLGDPNLEAQIYGRESCTYSVRARRLLEGQGVKHTYIDLDRPENQRLLPLLQAQVAQRTVPFVFVRGRFVGGMTELDELVRLGQLHDSPGARVEVLAPPAEQPERPPAVIELQAALEGTSDRKRPNRPETHAPVAMMKLMDLGLEVEAEADGEPVTMALLEAVAVDQDVSVAQLLAGAALMQDLTFEKEADVRFKVCTGHCQRWGALPRLVHLLSLHREAQGDRKANFDIEPVECLNRCDRAPAVVVHSPDGVAALDRVADVDLDAAVTQLCVD